MRIYYRTGIELPAGVVRTLIPGHAKRGETSGSDLVGVMQLFGLRPVYKRIAFDLAQPLFKRAVVLGIPPIVLGRWVSPAVLHWLLIVDAMTTGMVVNDPWGGRRYFLPWNLTLQRYAGECIV